MNYREEVLRTLNPEVLADVRSTLTNGGMGLAGESGEVCDIIKKHVFHGTELQRDKLVKELGDVRWYLELIAHAVGVSMEEIETINVNKLRTRYPNGFSTADSEKRVDVK